MQLSPGERSILSYFPTSSKAQEAVTALKEAGISEVQLDRVSRYGAMTLILTIQLIMPKH